MHAAHVRPRFRISRKAGLERVSRVFLMPQPPEAFHGRREAFVCKIQEGSHWLREVFGSLWVVIRNIRTNSEKRRLRY